MFRSAHVIYIPFLLSISMSVSVFSFLLFHAPSCSYSIGVCKHALSRGVWGHASPGIFLNLQSLRWFLVAPETTYTVWIVSAYSKLIRIVIEGPEFESVNFEEILDILRSLTDVFRFKNPTL